MITEALSQVVDLLTVEIESRPDPFLEVIRDLVVSIAMKREECNETPNNAIAPS